MTDTSEPADRFDLQDFTPYLLNIAAEQNSLAFSRIYKARYGMTRSEWRVLFHLGRYGPMTASAIGARAKLHKTKISRAVHALEEKRFLTRQALAQDRRCARLELRLPGRAAYADLAREAARFEAALEARIGAQDAQVLRRVLRLLAEMP